MIRYEVLQTKPYLLKALTGVDLEAFDRLLVSFTRAWDDFVEERFIRGRARQRAYGGGRRALLREPADKLLFILFYVRHYPIQEVQGFFFGLSQEQANDWIHRLTPILTKALGYEAQLPERRPHRLDEVLSEVPALEFFLDATERPRQRPKDPERQKRYYSGKKKRHTIKNLVITDRDGRLCYVGKTVEGKRSDKAQADQENYRFPEGSTGYKDKGFQGYAQPGVNWKQPKKKPRGGQLTDEEKAENRLINQVRVKVEHALAGVKVFRIVSDVFRNRKQDYEDAVMEIASGLHNFRLAQRWQDQQARWALA